jgi:opacity protein-like surface antigen
MKKILGASLIVVGLVVPVAARSQITPNKPAAGAAAARTNRVMFGPWAGANFATLGGKDAAAVLGAPAETRTGLAAGGVLQFALGSSAFLRTGALYSQRGGDASSGGVTGGIHLTYIEVPVMLGLMPAAASSFRPFLMVGGHVGFKLDCKVEGSSGGVGVSYKCDDPALGYDIRSMDLALAGGAGVMLTAGRGTVTIDARYVLGMQSIDNTSGAGASDIKNRGVTVGIGYLMPLGK